MTWLLSNCLFALILALLVFGLSKLKKFGPATMHALWVLVLFKMVSPLGIWWQVDIAVAKSEPTIAEPKSLETPIADREMLAKLEQLLAQSPTAAPLDSEAAPIMEFEYLAPRMAAPVVMEPSRSSPAAFLLALIAFGGAVYMLRQVLVTVRFHMLARSAAPAPDALARQVGELAAGLGIRGPLVKVLRGLCSPLVWVLRRPILLWPEGLERSLDRNGRETVLIHELAHLRRRDHWVRWLELACGLVHWWNPLYWFVRRQVRTQAELACDAWVTAVKPEHRRAYAEALLQVCSRTMRDTRAVPAMGIRGEGKRDFQRRLTMIMQSDSPCRLSGKLWIGAAALVMALVPAWSFGDDKGEKKAVTVETIDLAIDADFDVLLGGAVAATDETAKKAREIEAKIAELTKELARLKGAKEGSKGQPVDVKPTIRYLHDGKIIEAKSGEIKFGEGGTIKIVVDTEKGEKAQVKPEVKVFAKDGKEVKEFKVITVTKDTKDGKPHVIAVGPDGKQLENVQIFVLQHAAAPATAQGLVKPVDPSSAPKAEELKKMIDAHLKMADGERKVIELKMKEAAEAKGKAEEARKAVTEKLADELKTLTLRARVAQSGQPETVNLVRATYKLPKEKAETLGKFLKENVKASVLEMKFESDALIVTTTPEAQSTISNLVSLMLGQPIRRTAIEVHGVPSTPARVAPTPFEWQFVPGAPMPPKAPPAPPAAPELPKRPTNETPMSPLVR